MYQSLRKGDIRHNILSFFFGKVVGHVPATLWLQNNEHWDDIYKSSHIIRIHAAATILGFFLLAIVIQMFPQSSN